MIPVINELVHGSIPGDRLVQAQHDPADRGPRRQLGFVDARAERRVADVEELTGLRGMAAEELATGGEELEQRLPLAIAGRSCQGLLVEPLDPVRVRTPGCRQERPGQDPRGLDERGVVEEREGLLGRVGDGPGGGALLARGASKLASIGWRNVRCQCM